MQRSRKCDPQPREKLMVETEPEVTKMMELTDKDAKIAVKNVLKDLRKT